MPQSTRSSAHGVLRTLAGVALACLAATAVSAQTLTERQARQQVAAPRGIEVVFADLGVSGDAISRLLGQLEQQARQLPYYGAFVISPGDPEGNQAGLGVANYHSPQAAARAALAACEARRTTGGPCMIVAQTVPRGYKPDRLTLSSEATEALRGPFRRLDSPKAFAISPATGQFGFARGDGSRALATCNAAAADDGAQDCRIVVADR